MRNFITRYDGRDNQCFCLILMDNRIFDGYARYRKICRLSTWQAQPHRQDFLEEEGLDFWYFVCSKESYALHYKVPATGCEVKRRMSFKIS